MRFRSPYYGDANRISTSGEGLTVVVCYCDICSVKAHTSCDEEKIKFTGLLIKNTIRRALQHGVSYF
jgi:hypothetical protein